MQDIINIIQGDKVTLTWNLMPLIIVVVGTFLGILFKRYLFSKLKNLSDSSSWKGDDVVINAIDSVIVFWFFLGSLSVAFNDINFGDPYNGYISKIILSFLVMSMTITASRVSLGLLDVWSKNNKSLPSTGIFKGLINATIFSLGFLFVLQSFVSLALKDTLSDLFGGINIILSKTMKEGDYVELSNGYQGYVKNIGWRYTTIQERANNVISIPNSVLSGSVSKNYTSMDAAFRVPIQIGVSYDSDLDHVEKVALEVAGNIYDELDCVSKDYKPTIRFREFAGSSINFFIYFQGKKFGDHNVILNAFIKKIHKRFQQESIEIPYPIRTVIHKNEAKN